MSVKGTMLLVDDEANVLRALKRLMVDTGYTIFTADSGEAGLKILEENEIQLVISDYRMPGLSGVEFLSRVKEKSPDTIRIILSGYADAGAIVGAINQGHVYKFIPKPWDDQNLLSTIKDSFERYYLQKENTSLYAELSIKYKELQSLTRTLEDKVAERTRDLRMKNLALEVAQNILNYLPVGVIGVDPAGFVVYKNRAFDELLPELHLSLGMPMETAATEAIALQITAAMEEGQRSTLKIDKSRDIVMMSSPLPRQAGAIALFIKCRINEDGVAAQVPEFHGGTADEK